MAPGSGRGCCGTKSGGNYGTTGTGTERKCLPRKGHRYRAFRGREERRNRVFYHGEKREQPKPHLCDGWRRNPHGSF